MKKLKKATVIWHKTGYFLAIDGNLNNRDAVINGFNHFTSVESYFKKTQKTYGDKYDFVDEDGKTMAVTTVIDLNNGIHYPAPICVDDLWDPKLNRINRETGEIITLEEKLQFCDEIKDGIQELEHTMQSTKKLIDIMKAKKNRSDAAKKGWETRRAKIQQQLDEEFNSKGITDDQWQQNEIEKIEECKHAEEYIEDDFDYGSEGMRPPSAISAIDNQSVNAQIEDDEEQFVQAINEAIAYKEAENNELLEEAEQEIDEEALLLHKIITLKNERLEYEYQLKECTDSYDRECLIFKINKLLKKDRKLHKKLNKKYPINKQVEDEAPAQEASQTFNNHVNTENMETNEIKNGKPFVKRAKRGLAKGTEFGVTATTDLVIGTLIVGSDILFTMAEGVAWAQAAAIKPLGLHPDATRRELKEAAIDRAERRTAMMYSVPQAVVKLPGKIVAMKRASKERNDANIVDIPNVEVVQ